MKNRPIRKSSLNVKLESVRSIPGEAPVRPLQLAGTHLRQLQVLYLQKWHIMLPLQNLVEVHKFSGMKNHSSVRLLFPDITWEL